MELARSIEPGPKQVKGPLPPSAWLGINALLLIVIPFFALKSAVSGSQGSVFASEVEAAKLAKEWNSTAIRRSIELYLGAHKEWQTAAEFQRSAHCLRQAGRLYLLLGEYESATNSLERALKLERHSGHAAGIVHTLSLLSLVKLAEGKTQIGHGLAEDAVNLAERSGDPSARACAFFSAAEFSYVAGNSERTVELNRQAAENAFRTGETELQAHTELGLAYAYLLHGDPVSALATARNSLNKWLLIGDGRGQALTRVAIGQIHALTGDKRASLENFQSALETFPQDIDLLEKARLFNGIAGVYGQYGDWELSRINHRRAYELFKQINYPIGQLATLPSLVKADYLTSRSMPQKETYDETLRLSRQVNDQLYIGFMHEVLGTIHVDQGALDKGISFFQQSLKNFRTLNFKRGTVRVLNLLGSAYVRTGENEAARRSLDEALQMSVEIKSRADEAAVEFNRARLNLVEHKYEEALAGIRRAIQFGDSEHLDTLNSKLRQAYFSDVFDHYELYIGLLMKQHQDLPLADYAVQGLQSSERSRARNLLDKISLAEADVTSGADPDTVKREKEIRILLSTKADKLTNVLSGNADQNELEKLEGEIKELENELETTIGELKHASGQFSALKAPPPFDLREFQQVVLDERTVLLEYFLGDDESYLWAVDKSDISAFVLPGRKELESKIENLRSLLTARQPKSGESIDEQQARLAAAEREYWPAARELSNLLLGGAADKLRDKRLIVVPDGKLHYLPFSALPFPHSEADEPMLLTNEVVYQPSAQTLTLLKQLGTKRSAAERRDLLIYSDPVFSTDDERLSGLNISSIPTEETKPDTFRFVESLGSLPRLPGSKTETAAVIESSGTKAADSFSGFAANRERLLNTDLSAYKVLHFATHGIVFDDRPELSGIVLSRFGEQGQQMNEFIRLQDIYGMKLNADLVVLSACDTGVGKEVKGEGIMSLNTAFLQSGARSVLASLWKVEDGAAQKLMKEFYSGISIENLTPSESLRRAQISLAKDPRYASPFYWAAFTLQGDPNVRPAIGRRSISLWALTAFPIWFAAAYFAWRRRVK